MENEQEPATLLIVDQRDRAETAFAILPLLQNDGTLGRHILAAPAEQDQSIAAEAMTGDNLAQLLLR
jgi:hypothetical protein